MRCVRSGLACLLAGIVLSGCGQGGLATSPLAAETIAQPAFHAQSLGEGPNSVTCGAPVLQVAERLVRQARERFRLTELSNERDVDRAAHDLATFLSLKLGSQAAVCSTFAKGTPGQRDYGEEAAAMLLGVMDVRDDVPALEVPYWFRAFIHNRSQSDDQPALMGTLRDFGLSRPLAHQLASELANAKVFGDDATVRFPFRNDLEEPYVFAAEQAKREFFSAGPGTDPWRRPGSRADRYGAYTGGFDRYAHP